MKRILLFVLFVLLFNVKLQAQEAHFGAKGGLNVSTIVGDFTTGINPRLSGHIGVFINYDFSEKFSFQPELLYSSQGFRFNTDLAFIESDGQSGNETDFTSVVQQNYLSIPLIGQFRLSDRVDLEFGPQFAFFVNEVIKIKNFDGIDAENVEEKETRSGNFQLDYGIAFGIGVHVTEAFSISPRLYLGIRNRLNNSIGDGQNYNLALQLSMNYMFL